MGGLVISDSLFSMCLLYISSMVCPVQNNTLGLRNFRDVRLPRLAVLNAHSMELLPHLPAMHGRRTVYGGQGCPPPLPFDPATMQAASDLIICTDGSYTSATSVDPPRAGWGFTVSRGYTFDEYASDRGPLDHADLVELKEQPLTLAAQGRG